MLGEYHLRDWDGVGNGGQEGFLEEVISKLTSMGQVGAHQNKGE